LFSNFETFQLIFIIIDGKDFQADDEIRENIWGEILERTFSEKNDNALEKETIVWN
jgi:hypothetical protein